MHPPELRTSKVRNPSGVNTKLANFRYVDPNRPGGLSGALRLDYLVWDQFAHDLPRLRKVVEAIRRNYRQLEVEREIDDPDESAPMCNLPPDDPQKQDTDDSGRTERSHHLAGANDGSRRSAGARAAFFSSTGRVLPGGTVASAMMMKIQYNFVSGLLQLLKRC